MFPKAISVNPWLLVCILLTLRDKHAHLAGVLYHIDVIDRGNALLNLLFKFVLILALLAGVIALAIRLYLQQPQFADPQLDLDKLSGQGATLYTNGKFRNTEPTVVVQKQQSTVQTLYNFLIRTIPNAIPPAPLPSYKTDLSALSPADNVIIWMGHSSYFIQFEGVRMLVDPVFSDYASPVPGTNVAFAGSNIYTVDDIPALDYLLITHDHWDHLDYPTVQGLKDKARQVVTMMGVGSYFTQWGWPAERIFEGEWGSVFHGKTASGNPLDIYMLPARHFSGRLLERNGTLWGSFALITQDHRYYFSGDSGYGQHFRDIGEAFGPFDVAILECGQYNPDWASIHMMPEQTAQAALDLQASAVMAAHNSKFKLAYHTWDDPMIRLTAASADKPYRLLMPLIGQRVDPDNTQQVFGNWWEQVQ
jgi:L-ascorbate metabolism protein UlaG (beta-lactamase superfamily)